MNINILYTRVASKVSFSTFFLDFYATKYAETFGEIYFLRFWKHCKNFFGNPPDKMSIHHSKDRDFNLCIYGYWSLKCYFIFTPQKTNLQSKFTGKWWNCGEFRVCWYKWCMYIMWSVYRLPTDCTPARKFFKVTLLLDHF